MTAGIGEGIVIRTYKDPGGGVRVAFFGYNEDDPGEETMVGVNQYGIFGVSGPDCGPWDAWRFIYLTGLLVGSLGAIGD